ncbi:MAG: hypothetical protein D6798_06715 [Deltaproteobacteria bacterium]|nr:MAG: hypothetical protein D6798_06715 [Deltaproteobacteria bacterium]
MIRWWVGLWDRREAADSLAMVRALVPWLFTLAPPTADTASVAFWGAVVASAGLAAGIATRLSAVVLVLLLAQLALILPAADRGIDMLIRNTLLVLACSGAGRAWSVDARLRTGRWAGDRRPIPSWPRYLLVVQLVLLYGTAGMQKVASSWLPPDWSALWIALHDPHFGRFDADWTWSPGMYQASRLATAVTWVWEWAAPLVLVAFWARDTEGRPGRRRAALRRGHILALYAALGVVFHLGTHLLLRLGIFPFAVLSLYPALVHPDAWAGLVTGIRHLRGGPP